MVWGSFTKDIRKAYLKNSLNGCFGNLNLRHIGRSEKERLLTCFKL